jgi:hypothetical protein
MGGVSMRELLAIIYAMSHKIAYFIKSCLAITAKVRQEVAGFISDQRKTIPLLLRIQLFIGRFRLSFRL